MTQVTDQLIRLRWQCRRGMLELDIILLNFFDHHYAQLSEQDKSIFQRLLKCNDQDLYWWLIGSVTPTDVELKSMVASIKQLENIKPVT